MYLWVFVDNDVMWFWPGGDLALQQGDYNRHGDNEAINEFSRSSESPRCLLPVLKIAALKQELFGVHESQSQDMPVFSESLSGGRQVPESVTMLSGYLAATIKSAIFHTFTESQATRFQDSARDDTYDARPTSRHL